MKDDIKYDEGKESMVLSNKSPHILINEKQKSLVKPLVSVITIVFNGVNDIERTIKSVAGQIYDNVEYVVVDGGSADGTIDIIRKYEDKIDVWISEKDKGISDAFNKGISIASGDYVIFMNCGDEFYSDDVIQRVVPFILLNPSAVIYGNAVAGGKLIQADHNKIFLKTLLSNPICHQAAFVPKSMHRKILYDMKYKYSMDFDVWHRFICIENISFVKVDIVVADYMVGGLTSSIRNLENVIFEHWLIKQLYYPAQNKLYAIMQLLFEIIKAKIKFALKIFLGNGYYEYLKKKIKKPIK